MGVATLTPTIQEDILSLIDFVGYDFDRISIADHDLNSEGLVLWIEDKLEFKSSVEECIQLNISNKRFSNIIRTEQLNSFEGQKINKAKGFIYKARIEINEPIKWYLEDANEFDRQFAREAALKAILTQLIES